MIARPAGLLLALVALPSFAAGQGPRVVVAASTSPAATFAARPQNGNAFTTLPEKADIFAGDVVVSLPGGTLSAGGGAVVVRCAADFDNKSPLPILETAFSLAESKEKGTVLDLTLDRGRVDITNMLPHGPDGVEATVRVRFWDQNWKITLDGPGTRVAVELSGRWPLGSRFKPAAAGADPAKLPAPVAQAVLVVLSGNASVDVGGTTVAMKAPPGAAELQWNSIDGVRPQAQKLEKLPVWADPATQLSEAGKKTAAACEKFRAARAADAAKALDDFLTARDAVEQRVALVTIGGLDDFERIGRALAGARTVEERDFGVTVLRHWLGRSRGQDQRLYEGLKARGYSEDEARTVLQLLFGFSAEDATFPETYEVLIEYLVHAKPAVRNLAAWHLVRLAPQGKAIPFKPDGTDDDARKCRDEWKKLVPNGKLPPGPSDKKNG